VNAPFALGTWDPEATFGSIPCACVLVFFSCEYPLGSRSHFWINSMLRVCSFFFIVYRNRFGSVLFACVLVSAPLNDINRLSSLCVCARVPLYYKPSVNEYTWLAGRKKIAGKAGTARSRRPCPLSRSSCPFPRRAMWRMTTAATTTTSRSSTRRPRSRRGCASHTPSVSWPPA